MADLILSSMEIEALTGYKQPAMQLSALKAQGFHRARRNAAGHVVLERAHYDAVCTGREQTAPPPALRPVKPPRLRTVT